MSTIENKANDPERYLWEAEDQLINQRITWLGVSQGLLFAAYAVILNFKNSSTFYEMQFLIPVLGSLISLFVLIGVIAAIGAMLIISNCKEGKNLKKADDPKADDPKAGDSKAGDSKAGDSKAGDSKADDTIKLHQLGISPATTILGLVPALGIPLIFLCSWIFVFASINPKASIGLFFIIFVALGVAIALTRSAIKNEKDEENFLKGNDLKLLGLSFIIFLLLICLLFYYGKKNQIEHYKNVPSLDFKLEVHGSGQTVIKERK